MAVYEILYRQDLAEVCADDEVYELLYAASPLNIAGEMGGPSISKQVRQ